MTLILCHHQSLRLSSHPSCCFNNSTARCFPSSTVTQLRTAPTCIPQKNMLMAVILLWRLQTKHRKSPRKECTTSSKNPMVVSRLWNNHEYSIVVFAKVDRQLSQTRTTNRHSTSWHLYPGHSQALLCHAVQQCYRLHPVITCASVDFLQKNLRLSESQMEQSPNGNAIPCRKTHCRNVSEEGLKAEEKDMVVGCKSSWGICCRSWIAALQLFSQAEILGTQVATSYDH